MGASLGESVPFCLQQVKLTIPLHLIVAKRAAGRDQDHLDLKIPEEAKKFGKG